MKEPVTARDLFIALLDKLKETQAAHRAVRDALQAEYNDAIKVEAKRLYPTARKDHEEKWRKFNPATLEAFIAPWKERALGIGTAQRVEIDAQTKRLTEVAENVTPESSPVLTAKCWETWSSTYSSQGWGASQYAKNAAESRADIARALGLTVEVRRIETTVRDSPNFEVWVGVASEIDVEILQRKPGLPLREWVRLCWKRGVNPRVYNPWLPHGYEEQVGLDYFGGEVKR